MFPFTASKGDVISILGRSGSGKSTFLRCINFLETPTSGTITLDNYSISISSTNPQKPSKKQILELRTQTAMVFQQFNLWSHMTVLKNIGITLGWSLRNQIRSNARCYNLYYQQQLSNIL